MRSDELGSDELNLLVEHELLHRTEAHHLPAIESVRRPEKRGVWETSVHTRTHTHTHMCVCVYIRNNARPHPRTHYTHPTPTPTRGAGNERNLCRSDTLSLRRHAP